MSIGHYVTAVALSAGLAASTAFAEPAAKGISQAECKARAGHMVQLIDN